MLPRMLTGFCATGNHQLRFLRLIAGFAVRAMQRQSCQFRLAAPARHGTFGDPARSLGLNPEDGQLQFEVTVRMPNFSAFAERPLHPKVGKKSGGSLCRFLTGSQVGAGKLPEPTQQT